MARKSKPIVKILLAGAGIAGIYALTASNAKAGTKSSIAPVLVRNHDADWDYKYENGIWYTKRKTAASWLVMKDNLSPENFQLAVARLQKYFN